MADHLFESAYEYLAEDGSTSDECLRRMAVFRQKCSDQEHGLCTVPVNEANETTLAAMDELEADLPNASTAPPCYSKT